MEERIPRLPSHSVAHSKSSARQVQVAGQTNMHRSMTDLHPHSKNKHGAQYRTGAQEDDCDPVNESGHGDVSKTEQEAHMLPM